MKQQTQRKPQPRYFFLIFLLLITLLSFIFAVSIGSTSISWSQIWDSLWSQTPTTQQMLIFELRLPRALAAFACGAMLSLAGLLMQVLLRNPLADPYVLGVSGGAATMALLGLLIGLSGGLLNLIAFAGALVSIFLVFYFSHNEGTWTVARLLLTGIVMAAGWGALISFLLIIAPPEKIHSMLFWLMGDLSYDRPLLPAYLFLFIGLIIAMPLGNSLNIMTWGDLHAGALGINTSRLRLILFFLASLLTAGAVTLAGSVGFVGLVIPHLLRLIVGSEHRLLIPASVLAGGSLLVLADTLARTILSPQQLPVGIITALIGVPLFLYLLRRSS